MVPTASGKKLRVIQSNDYHRLLSNGASQIKGAVSKISSCKKPIISISFLSQTIAISAMISTNTIIAKLLQHKYIIIIMYIHMGMYKQNFQVFFLL